MTGASQVPVSACRHCLRVADAATPASGAPRPKPGDVAVCLYCHRLNVYGDGLQLRLPTVAEIRVFERDPRLRQIIAAMRIVKTVDNADRQ